jgi:SAM-dependent methyltransferase
MTQRKETIDFWNVYHTNESDKEWIVKPSAKLLDYLQTWMPKDATLLEIGCGTSYLARYLYLCERFTGTCFLVTDVSPVCVDINRKRDASLLSDRFQYQVLDALDPPLTLKKQHFDVVMDKGCLDTFLYRSSHGEKLVISLLENVHQMLKNDGRYIIFSPRRKIRLIRDYKGFQFIERISLSSSNSDVGDLCGETRKSVVFLHIYRKSVQQNPNKGEMKDLDDLSESCSRCGMTFQDFCKSNEITSKVMRRWKGHRTHCQGKN